MKYCYFTSFLALNSKNESIRGNATFWGKKANKCDDIVAMTKCMEEVRNLNELTIMSITILDKKLW